MSDLWHRVMPLIRTALYDAVSAAVPSRRRSTVPVGQGVGVRSS